MPERAILIQERTPTLLRANGLSSSFAAQSAHRDLPQEFMSAIPRIVFKTIFDVRTSNIDSRADANVKC
jgi:hypothetical protein